MESKKISVAIVTKNRPSLLKKALRTLAWQNKKPDQVILVENNDKKTLNKLINKFQGLLNINYVLEKETGVASARNLAIKTCRNHYLCFTDDDCLLHPDWLKTIYHEIEKEEDFTYLIGDSLIANPQNIFAQMQGTRQKYWLRKRRTNSNYLTDGYLDTKNIVINVQHLKKNKLLFNEKLNKNSWGDISDQELGIRMNDLGLKGKFVPKMIVFHKEAESLKEVLNKAYLRGKNSFILGKINGVKNNSYLLSKLLSKNSFKNDWDIFSRNGVLKTMCLILLSKLYDFAFSLGYIYESNQSI